MAPNDLLARVTWRKSSYSGGGGPGNGDCVELALAADMTAIRDSKNPTGHVLIFPAPALASLLANVAAR